MSNKLYPLHMNPIFSVQRLFKQGFTLIEIVMVMVILSVLAIVAAPRFFSLKDSANKIVQKNTIAAVNNVLALGAVKASVDGVTNGKITVNNQDICVNNSYPAVKASNDCANLLALMDIKDLQGRQGENEAKKTIQTSEIDNKTGTLYIVIDQNCFVTVTEPQGTDPKPMIATGGTCDD